MAKLATMRDAFGHENTNQTITRLIDGFYSDPLSPTGRHVGKIMAVGQQEQVVNSNPIIQIFQQLPPELQNALMEKAVTYIAGNKGSTSPF